MGKLWNYVILCIVLILITRFSGFDTGASTSFGQLANVTFKSANDTLCPNCIDNVDVSGSSIWSYLFNTEDGILAMVAGVAGLIAAGLFARGKGENFILLPLASIVLVLFLQTFSSIIVYAWSTGIAWGAAIITLITLPLAIGFVIACAEFFRGTD